MTDLFGKQRNYVKYGDSTLINYGDFHTHSIYSLHGISSTSEMVDVAINAGLEYIALTDHHIIYGEDDNNRSDFISRKNQIARAYEINRSFMELDENGIIKVIPGYEYNLFTSHDSSSFVGDDIPHLRLLGYHTWYADLNLISINNYIEEIDGMLSTGMYKIFVHPERDIDNLGKITGSSLEDENNLRYLMERICEICEKNKVVIEINNSSLSNPLNSEEKKKRIIERIKCLIRKAQLFGVFFVVNSDAHVKYGVGRCYEAFKLLYDMGVNKRQIVNFDEDLIKEFILP